MTPLVLAGDVGGTKTDMAVYAVEPSGGLALIRERVFASRDHDGLASVIREFLADGGERFAAAAFGIAGPIVGDSVETTNLPWRIERADLVDLVGGAPVRMLNDLEATANGALFLPSAQVRTLQPGRPAPGNRGVIAAGTGLGQAFLYWDGARYHPVATEGGHVDFAPRSEIEIELLRFLQRRYGTVSWERVVSGPGLQNIFEYLVDELGRPVAAAARARIDAGDDPSAVVGEAGVAGSCSTCVEAVELFVGAYGAQTGNLALSVMALGGVYVAGGIAAKMLPVIERGGFLAAFRNKGRYADLMLAIPVWIILDAEAARLGAAHAAADLV
jgi:glucokinase